MYVRGYLQGSENGRVVTIEMSRWSPVYVPEIETGRHVKNNACTVEIKIKWMIRKHMTYENTYRDDIFTWIVTRPCGWVIIN
jgi:hypothetical protein